MANTESVKKKKTAAAKKPKSRKLNLKDLIVKPTETKPKKEKAPTEILMDKDGLPILPPLIVGPGYTIANVSSLERAVLCITDPTLCMSLYEWDCDIVPYNAIHVIKVNGQYVVALSTVVGSEDFEGLVHAAPALHKHLSLCVVSRKQMLAKAALPGAQVPYVLLAELLAGYVGKYVVYHNLGRQWYGKITRAQRFASIFNDETIVTMDTRVWVNGKLCRKENQIRCYPTMDACRTLLDWGFDVAPSVDTIEKLRLRGARIINLHENCAYVRISGNMNYKVMWYTRQAAAAGRAIIDKTGYSIFRPSEVDHEINETHSILSSAASSDDLCSVDPDMVIFSFVAKRWGTVDVSQVHEITFREDAFEKLVLPPEDKKLVLSLVKNSDASMVSDLIDNKGGGCVMLLHGKPGLGKTLTAEAVAETLQRPLYAVSVGELGTNPETLEENLQNVLQTAQRWNAVLLLDEADVFLESRHSGDIERNAMVGTFLRMLEYYNGVLLLTTNRVADMDTAFYSRISLALRYGDFTIDTRKQVISNLLDTNGVTLSPTEIDTLAATGVNGRQIKNAIRIARFIAKDENRAVHAEDVMTVLNKLLDFQNSFSKAEEPKDESPPASGAVYYYAVGDVWENTDGTQSVITEVGDGTVKFNEVRNGVVTDSYKFSNASFADQHPRSTHRKVAT